MNDGHDVLVAKRLLVESSSTYSPKSKPSSTTTSDIGYMRRVKDDLPRRLWAVVVIGFFERAAFWGLTAPWQNYMEQPLHYTGDQIPGALGLGQVKATQIYCGFFIFYYFTPLCVAPLADGHLGQYRALVISVLLYCCGCIVLTITSLPSNLAKGWGLSGLILAMILIGLGGGSFKSITAAFIADQYTDRTPRVKTTSSGEEVITDPELTLQYIYNLNFWVGNVGSLSWVATVYIERKHGFAGAYALALCAMVIALVILLLGKSHYVTRSNKDATLLQATGIIICAIKNDFKMKCARPEFQAERHQTIVSWSAELVDELKEALLTCRVLLAFIMFYICFDQMQNNLISQAGQMKNGRLPNDLMPAMNQVGVIVIAPLIQRGLYPLLEKRRICMGPIKRVTVGFVFIVLAMLYAALVQRAIYNSPPCYHHPTHCRNEQPTLELELKQYRPNIWIQAPLYFLIATGEIFAVTTGMEYAYTYSPNEMKVIVQAINMLLGSFGSVVAMLLAQVAHDPNLTYLYASLTAAMGVVTIIFWLVFRKLDKRKPTTTRGSSESTPSILAERRAKERDFEQSSLEMGVDTADWGTARLKYTADVPAVKQPHSSRGLELKSFLRRSN